MPLPRHCHVSLVAAPGGYRSIEGRKSREGRVFPTWMCRHSVPWVTVMVEQTVNFLRPQTSQRAYASPTSIGSLHTDTQSQQSQSGGPRWKRISCRNSAGSLVPHLRLLIGRLSPHHGLRIHWGPFSAPAPSEPGYHRSPPSSHSQDHLRW